MASAFPGQVTAVQYYPFLQQTPNLVHQFYTNASTMIRYDGDTNESASGMAEIHNLIVGLNLTEIEIKTAHSLESWNGGVLVTVTEEQVQHPVAMLTPNDYDTKLDALDHVQEPASSYMLGEDIPERDFISPPVLVDENNQIDNFFVPGQSDQTPDSDEITDETPIEQPSNSVLIVPNILQDPVPEEEPVGERPKHTYASVLRTAKAQVAPQLSSVNKTAPVELSDWHHAPQATQQQVQSTISYLPENSGAELLDEVSAFEEDGESKSVYVGNLPASISTSDLEQEFRNFGRIKPDGVTIRSRKEAGVFYAFIEYEDAAGVQNALKASPVQLNGRLIHVEGRRPNSGASRGGRRGRGRGGYHTEAPRGRFGGRSFGGNDRDYSNRPRSNGYLQRVPLPRQERGILGSHFPKDGGSQSETLAS